MSTDSAPGAAAATTADLPPLHGPHLPTGAASWRLAWAPRARHDAAMVLVAGVATDLAVRHGAATTSGAVALAFPAIVVARAAAPRRVAARAALAASAVFALALLWRRSAWLVPLDAIAAACLAIIALVLEQRDRRTPLRFAELSAASGDAAGVLVRAPVHVALLAVEALPSTTGARRRQAGAIGRGLAVGLPAAGVMAALLASADGVFRSFLRVPVPLTGLPTHAVTLAVGACLAVVPLAMGRRIPGRRRVDHDGDAAPRPQAGVTELATALTVLSAVALLFATAQATAIVRGDAYVLRTTGLTYADHARRGYFQLLAAAGIAAAVLLAARALRPPTVAGARQQLGVRIPGGVAAGSMLVLVAAALRRLALYNSAFGWTTLRLACVVFALWLAVAFVLLAASLVAGHRHDRLSGALLVSAVVTLGAWNVANPDAFVADRNLARHDAPTPLDVAYLAGLSDDAVPRLAEAASADGPDAERLRLALCARPIDERGGAAWNRSSSSAAAALRALCR